MDVKNLSIVNLRILLYFIVHSHFLFCLFTYLAQFSIACLFISGCKRAELHKGQQYFVIRVANIFFHLSFNVVYGALCHTELLKFQVVKYSNLYSKDFWVSCLVYYVPKPSNV